MSVRDKLSNLVSNALFNIAPIQSGVIVSFDNENNLAVIRCTHRSGRGFEYFELPWVNPGNGVCLPNPVPETSEVEGTHVVIGFRGFDWSYPVLLAAYDPLHYSNTRQRNKRRIDTFTTRSDKAISGQI